MSDKIFSSIFVQINWHKSCIETVNKNINTRNNWKFIYYKGFPPQLFDLKNDPDEFNDLGQSSDHSKIIEEMKDILLKRITNRKNRVAATDEFVLKKRDYTKDDGIMIGVW